MFGMAESFVFPFGGSNAHMGDQVRGFGFLHDGAVDTLVRFNAFSDFVQTPENPGGFPVDPEGAPEAPGGGVHAGAGVEPEAHRGPADHAHVVERGGGRPARRSARARAPTPATAISWSRAGPKGTSWAFCTSAMAVSTPTARARRGGRRGELRWLATRGGGELTYACVPPGSGERIGVDRDGDGFRRRRRAGRRQRPGRPGERSATGTARAVPVAASLRRNDRVRAFTRPSTGELPRTGASLTAILPQRWWSVAALAARRGVGEGRRFDLRRCARGSGAGHGACALGVVIACGGRAATCPRAHVKDRDRGHRMSDNQRKIRLGAFCLAQDTTWRRGGTRRRRRTEASTSRITSALRRRQAGQVRRRVPGGRARLAEPARSAGPHRLWGQLRAGHLVLCARGRHRAHRLHRHRVHHVRGALPAGPQVRLAGPYQPGAGRLERGHHRRGRGGGELQADAAPRPRAALCPGARVRRCGHRPVGQLGGRRLPPRQGVRGLLRPGKAAHARSQGEVLLRSRAAQHPASAAGTPGDRAGGVVGGRRGARGRDRRGDLHRAADAGRRAGLLRRRQRPDGQVRAAPRSAEDHAGGVPRGRQDGVGGQGEVPGAAGPHLAGGRAVAALGPVGRDRSVRVSGGRAAPRAARDQQQQEPASADVRHRAQALLSIRELYLWVAGARGHWTDRGLGGADRGSAGGVVHAGRRRRVQRDAAVAPGRAG